jgi:hypothetical protein
VIRRSAPALAIAAAFTVFFGLFFWPVLGRGLIFGDAVDQLIEALPMYLGGHPFWQPLSMLGLPYSANPLAVTWYPLAALRFLPGSFDAYELSAYVVAACGAFGLARAVTRSTTGAVVAGFVYALSGFMIGHAGHIGLIHPAAWAPWVFWSLVVLRERGDARSVAFAGAAYAMLALSGQPQVLIYTLFAMGAYCVVAWSRQFTSRLLAALALGTALAAIVLLPGVELALASTRAHLSLEEHVGFGVPVAALPFRLFFPYLLGQTTLAPYTLSAFNLGSFAEMSNYVGVTTLVLAAIGVTSRGGPRVGFWAGLLVAALLLSTGNDLGLGYVTYHIPGLNWFRAPGRYAFEVALAASVLAAAGIAAIERGAATPRAAAACAGAIGAAMTILLAIVTVFGRPLADVVTRDLGLAQPPLETVELTQNAALWIPALLFVLGAAAVVGFARRPHDALARSLLVAVTVVDLASFGWFGYWNFGAFPLSRVDPPPYAAALRAATEPAAQRVFSVPTQNAGDGISPNLNVLWDIASVRGYTTLALAPSAAFLRTDSAEALPMLFAPGDRTLDAAGVRFVVVPAGSPALTFLAAAPQRWRPVSGAGGDRVFENVRAFARAWIVHRALGTSAGDALNAILARRWDPAQAALVSPSAPQLDPAIGTATESVRIEDLAPTRMVLDATCSSRCLVITSDAVYPGWSARVDATAAPILAADYALRGVVVPAGSHRIVFTFVPWSTYAGAAISLLALGVAVELVRRRRRAL